MDAKAEKGYLVGYDGDERYRIYIKEKNKVILSRDVSFKRSLENVTEKSNCRYEASILKKKMSMKK